jgi:hypothetical protein
MSISASILSDFWHDQLVAHDRQALFLVLVGFLGSFLFIRVSARLGRSPRFPWWPGSVVSDSGVHLHHLVWGICLMLAAGAVGFASLNSSPWLEISAAVFGIGAGLTIDEFALWVYLDDVYWSPEGRSSIDAAVVAASSLLLLLLGARPVEVGQGGAGAIVGAVAVGLFLLLLVIICFAKQRLLHGAIGAFIFPVAVYGAIRVGKPGSVWARRFYGARRPRKQARAERRFRPDRRTERLKERFRDAVGGQTTEAYNATLAEALATDAAAAELRERAERVSDREPAGR